MSRAVTGDHVLFNECITMFRPEKIETFEGTKEVYGYLLLDFALTEPFHFEYFIIEPSIEAILPGAYKAFVARVKLPKWYEWSHNAHLFTIGLAAVFSFVSGRPVKAPRDGYASRREELDQQTISELAIQFPILFAGPGAHDTHLSHDSIKKLKENLQEVFMILFKIPYNRYKTIMQSIRLVQLAHLNKRDDFALGYYLLVSAIEPIATKVIRGKIFTDKSKIKIEWIELAEKNEEFKNLLGSYRQELSKNRHLGKRFVEFIMQYCPTIQWLELEHPYANRAKHHEEISGLSQEWITNQHWDEIYPTDLNDFKIRELLFDVYEHRSRFTHEGKNPPHSRPDSSNRFFDKERFIVEEENGNYEINEIILPNFQLISFIAQRSMLNYLRTLI